MRMKWATIHVPTSNQDWSVWDIMDVRGNIITTCLTVRDAHNYIKRCKH